MTKYAIGNYKICHWFDVQYPESIKLEYCKNQVKYRYVGHVLFMAFWLILIWTNDTHIVIQRGVCLKRSIKIRKL